MGARLLMAALTLAVCGSVASPVLAKKTKDPDFVLIICSTNVGIKSNPSFTRPTVKRRDLKNVKFEDYKLSPSYKMSKSQKSKLKACFTEKMSKN